GGAGHHRPGAGPGRAGRRPADRAAGEVAGAGGGPPRPRRGGRAAVRDRAGRAAAGDAGLQHHAGAAAPLRRRPHPPAGRAGPRLVARVRPLALRRALRNLVENAVAYGGRARVTLRREAGEAVVTVEDDGPGIPEDELERVFEPFVRLEGSRSRETGGVGLGLAIARSVVRAH